MLRHRAEFLDIDANGIVNVSAKDMGTGKEQKITISSSTNMSKDDINKAVQDAEKFAAEDKKRREEVDQKNEAENMCYAVEKLLKDNGDKIDEADKTDLNAKVASLKEAISANNADDMKSKSEELQKAMYAVSEKLYKVAAPQQPVEGQPADSTQGANGEHVYDAEYKDVDDNDKK